MKKKYLLLLVCYELVATLVAFLMNSMLPPMHVQASILHVHSTQSVSIAPPVIVIAISGSTNTCPATLYIHNTDALVASPCHPIQPKVLPPDLTVALLDDVITAQPLNALPQNHACMKPTSFRTTTTIIFKAQKSPDVSCSVDNLGKKLYQDIIAIKDVI